MNHLLQHFRKKVRQTRLALLLPLAAGVAACDTLLDVELPASLTEQTLESPASAETQVYSAMAFYECAYSELSYLALGFEDFWERFTGVAAPADYPVYPSGGGCDSSGNGNLSQFFDMVHISRKMAATVHDKLVNEWTVAQVPNKAQLQILSALYAAADIEILGTYFCESALDGGPLLTPEQTLLAGEAWIQTALTHIAADGDFAISDGISPSAQSTAYALRARMRWHRGDHTGALADALQVPMGFQADVTRESGRERRNKVYASGFAQPFGGAYVDINDWWDPPSRMNPVTGQPWPNPIPFTGYINLGLLPDGRAVTAAGLPIRTTVDLTATVDPRVATVLQQPIGGVEPAPTPAKYTSESDPIPWVSWREIWLIRAEIEGGAAAIQRVNEVRASHSPPLTPVTYADPGNATEIRDMIWEERRREFFAEGGRWWANKIIHPDVLWFPRGEGVFPRAAWPLQGGVRMLMAFNEYEDNENFTLADRATGCAPGQRPHQYN